jgi:hypothetical protein
MRRQSPAAEPVAAPVHEILPNGVYFSDDARRILRLRQSTIGREVREGRLRIAKRGGRYVILGKWLIEWIETGELKPRQSHAATNGKA